MLKSEPGGLHERAAKIYLDSYSTYLRGRFELLKHVLNLPNGCNKENLGYILHIIDS